MDNYTFPDLARRLGDELRKSEAAGKFARIDSSIEFANVLTQQLRELGNDKHLTVNFSPNVSHDYEKPTTEDIRQALEHQKFINSGVAEAKMIGAVGYLKINVFLPINDPNNPAGADMNKAAIDSAMKAVSGAKSLIIDLRDNDGGDTEAAVQIMSYLLPPNTHVSSIIWRNQDPTGAAVAWNEKEHGRKHSLELEI